LDTARAEPADISAKDEQEIWSQESYPVDARCVVVLEGR
jgi:hypothetical protein